MTPRLWFLTVVAVGAIVTINFSLWLHSETGVAVGFGIFLAFILPMFRIGWPKDK
jgi:hypothetical protein